MKVLHIIFTTTGYSVSGAVSAALAMATEINKKVETAVFIMSNKNAQDEKNGLSIKEFKASSGLLDFFPIPQKVKNLFLRSDFSDAISEYNPDIIHFHNPVPPLALYKTAKWCKKNSIPFVITSHGFNEIINFYSAFKVKKIWFFMVHYFVHSPFKYCIQNASHLFLLSKSDLSDLKTFMNTDDLTYDVTPNGHPVNIQHNKKLFVPKFESISSEKKPIVLFLGNHTNNKGIDVLVECTNNLTVDCKVIVGGKIRLRGGNHEFMGKKKVKLNKNIVFTDYLTEEEKYFLLQKCDLLVHPTRADTLPLVIIEAMFFEKAVVSTTVGGIASLVDEKTGKLVPPGDAKLLALAIDDLLFQTEKRLEMGRNGRKKLLKEFSWQKSAEVTLKAYKTFVDGKTDFE